MARTSMKVRATKAVAIVAIASICLMGVVGAVARSQPVAAGGTTGCQPSASTPVPQPTQAMLDAAGLGDLPLAPDSVRRDLVAAPLSDPTSVTNPLFPISELKSAILNGHVDGKVFHTETTLLPFTKIIEWTPGQCVRVLVSQYMAFLDGSLQETAIDLYAQADDGSVWYLGESVFDYKVDGLVLTTEGTWQAGFDGPFAMIMPSDPQIGDVNRAENIPGNSFEEVHVTKVDQTFNGPSGPVSGGWWPSRSIKTPRRATSCSRLGTRVPVNRRTGRRGDGAGLADGLVAGWRARRTGNDLERRRSISDHPFRRRRSGPARSTGRTGCSMRGSRFAPATCRPGW